ncbi:MAG: SRPBCC domain-containing protein [Gemmataceae bacterium]
MKFEGDMEFTQDITTLWPKLSDLTYLAYCIPDSKDFKDVSETTAACKVKPSFSFASATLNVSIERVQAEVEKLLEYRMGGKGVGISNEILSTLMFESSDSGGTRVHWTAEITKLGGLLKAVPKGLIEGAAKSVIGQIWDQVAEKIRTDLGGESDPTETSTQPE